MGMAQIPQQVASTVKQTTQQLQGRFSGRFNNKDVSRALAAGSLIGGAILLMGGKRKAALAIAAAGTAVALLEDPEGVKSVWNRIPSYIHDGQQLLSRFESFVEELSSQGDKIRTLLARAER